ncbi:MAG: FkbM family methyltransferase [Rhodobacteraceae bacterium]|nr:FkbM family methyltransferase [Paracoccaceae bacterium]
MKKLRRRLHLWALEKLGRETEVFAPHGIQVRVPAHSDPMVRYNLARGRPYEAPEAAMVSAHLAAGTNVIELGGCLGILSAFVRQKIGPDAHHIVVEALPDLADICEENASIGAAPGKTRVVRAAIDYSGAESVTFAVAPNAHSGHLAKSGERGVTVPAVTLSDLANQLPDGRFALLCDIEGAEIAMIENDKEALRRASLFIVETHPKLYPGKKDAQRQLLRAIAELGFEQLDHAADVFCFRGP